MEIPLEFPVEIVKAYEEGKKEEKEDTTKWIVEGLASTSDFDLQSDIVAPEALKDAENDLLENSTVLDNHDPNKRIGHVVECKAQDEGLWVKVLISKTAKDVWQQIKEGVLNKFSIRGRVVDAVKKYIKELGRIANVIRKMYLMECSLVSLPANPQAKTLRWYMSKSLKDFEEKGGEIPLAKNFDLDMFASSLESMKDRLNSEDKSTVSEIIESMKARDKYPYNYPEPKKKDESDEEYKARIEKDWADFLAGRKKKEEEEEAEKARKKKEEEEEVEKARKKKEEEEEVEKARKKKEEEDAEAEKARKKKEEEELACEKAKKGKEKYPYGYPYPAKKAGEAYSQVEVDGILADFRSSIEAYFEEKMTKKDKALMETKGELMQKLDSILEESKKVKTENEGLKADAKTEQEFDKVKDSYKEEDAPVIKGILKKTLMGQVVTPEEQRTLIEKKISSSMLIGGAAADNKFVLTPEKEKDIIEFSGIKTRIQQ